MLTIQFARTPIEHFENGDCLRGPDEPLEVGILMIDMVVNRAHLLDILKRAVADMTTVRILAAGLAHPPFSRAC